MKNLNEKELMQVQGGAVSKFLIGGLIVLGIFIAGVVDGYLRPYGCR